MTEPAHQLVFQFPEAAFSDFDALVRFEDALFEVLGDRHDVDGHDIGSGEVNFFVFTDNPDGAMAEIRDAAGGLLSHPGVRAAARPVGGDEFTMMWPVGDEEAFKIL